MLKTGLPYDMSLLETIRKEGAIVDMSSSEYDCRTSFIYLRNTDTANVTTLDFSGCNYEKKCEYLLEYIKTNIDVDNEIFVSTWYAILYNSLGIVLENQGFFTADETQKFVDDNVEFVGKVLQFLISIPVFAVKRFKISEDDDSIKLPMDIKTCDEEPVGINILHLIENDNYNALTDNNINLEPLDYTKYFTDKNNDLFECVSKLDYMPVLIGLLTTPNEEFKNIINEIKSFYGYKDSNVDATE